MVLRCSGAITLQVNSPLFVSELWEPNGSLSTGIFMERSVSIGDRIRSERQRLDLNQTELGERGGVTKKTQMLYESGERFPDAAYLAAVSTAGVDVRYVVTGLRDSPPPPTLTSEERVLLDTFRALEPAMRKRILAFVLAGEPAGGKVIVHGRVGQQVEKIEGGVKIDMRDVK